MAAGAKGLCGIFDSHTRAKPRKVIKVKNNTEAIHIDNLNTNKGLLTTRYSPWKTIIKERHQIAYL